MKGIYERSDADKDGLLNLAEFLEYCKGIDAFEQEKLGVSMGYDNTLATKTWELVNTFTPSNHAGVSYADVSLFDKAMEAMG